MGETNQISQSYIININFDTWQSFGWQISPNTYAWDWICGEFQTIDTRDNQWLNSLWTISPTNLLRIKFNLVIKRPWKIEKGDLYDTKYWWESQYIANEFLPILCSWRTINNEIINKWYELLKLSPDGNGKVHIKKLTTGSWKPDQIVWRLITRLLLLVEL